MSFWKTKKNPRLRYCHVKISSKCQGIFKSKYKVSGKRAVCPECKKLLHKLKQNIWRYYKMQEPIEKYEWINDKEIRANIKNTIEIKEGEKVKGTKTEEYVQMTDIEEIKAGIENIEKMINKNEDQIRNFERQLKSLGKIPSKSSEMVRIENNLVKLAKIRKSEELIKKIEPLKEENNIARKAISIRKEFLNAKR